MARTKSVNFYGVLFILGILVQIVTSVTWLNFSTWVHIDPPTWGERYQMIGQDLGELIFIYCCRKLFDKKRIFTASADFGISLVLVDIFQIICLNPCGVNMAGYVGFIVASFVFLYRIKSAKDE